MQLESPSRRIAPLSLHGTPSAASRPTDRPTDVAVLFSCCFSAARPERIINRAAPVSLAPCTAVLCRRYLYLPPSTVSLLSTSIYCSPTSQQFYSTPAPTVVLLSNTGAEKARLPALLATKSLLPSTPLPFRQCNTTLAFPRLVLRRSSLCQIRQLSPSNVIAKRSDSPSPAPSPHSPHAAFRPSLNHHHLLLHHHHTTTLHDGRRHRRKGMFPIRPSFLLHANSSSPSLAR